MYSLIYIEDKKICKTCGYEFTYDDLVNNDILQRDGKVRQLPWRIMKYCSLWCSWYGQPSMRSCVTDDMKKLKWIWMRMWNTIYINRSMQLKDFSNVLC